MSLKHGSKGSSPFTPTKDISSSYLWTEPPKGGAKLLLVLSEYGIGSSY